MAGLVDAVIRAPVVQKIVPLLHQVGQVSFDYFVKTLHLKVLQCSSVGEDVATFFTGNTSELLKVSTKILAAVTVGPSTAKTWPSEDVLAGNCGSNKTIRQRSIPFFLFPRLSRSGVASLLFALLCLPVHVFSVDSFLPSPCFLGDGTCSKSTFEDPPSPRPEADSEMNPLESPRRRFCLRVFWSKALFGRYKQPLLSLSEGEL